MNKKTLAKFFIIYLTFFILFLALGIVFKITKFEKYQTHTTKLWNEKNYLANVLLKKPTLYANKDSKAYASEIPNGWPLSGLINGAIKTYECATSNQGFVQCSLTSFLDTQYEPIIGGTFSNCKEDLVKLNNGEEIIDNEKCNFNKSSVGGILDANNRSINNNLYYKPFKGSLLSIVNNVGVEFSRESDNIANIAYFNKEIVQQFPIIGNRVANAGFEEETIKYLALGPSFFELWKASRNMTYFLIIIPTIAFGFAIMFKMQVGSQTQITLMKALPRLLITIIFITFSYPLIALLVQLAKPVTDIGVALVWSFTDSFSVVDATVGNSVSEYGFVLGLIVGLFKWVYSLVFGGYAMIVTFFPLLLVGIIAVIRNLVATITTTIKLGFLIAFGPLIILISAFPGREGILKNYFLNVCAKIFGLSLISIMWTMGIALWLSSWEMGGIVISMIVGLAAIGIIWKTPSAPKLLATAIGAQPLFEEITGGGQAAGGKRR